MPERAQMRAGERVLRHALIVDDHPLFCDAISMTLKLAAGLERVETSGRLEEACQRLERAPLPDLVVLDLHLPDVEGLDGLLRLRRLVPDLPVLVVSSLADNRVIAAALRAGAVGFVPKHSHRDIYRAAILALREGRVYLPEGFQPEPDLARSGGAEAAVARLGLLTRQQARILELLCEGKLNKQIAYDLNIAETTVKAHVTAIMRKLGVLSRTQAVLMAKQVSFATILPDEG